MRNKIAIIRHAEKPDDQGPKSVVDAGGDMVVQDAGGHASAQMLNRTMRVLG
jgi:hypothetical protein